MNKRELVEELARRTDLPVSKSRQVVRALFDTPTGLIAEELGRGGSVELTGFASLGTAARPARRGRDPRSGRRIEIPARRACVFRPRKGLRSSMKDMVGA